MNAAARWCAHRASVMMRSFVVVSPGLAAFSILPSGGVRPVLVSWWPDGAPTGGSALRVMAPDSGSTFMSALYALRFARWQARDGAFPPFVARFDLRHCVALALREGFLI